MRFSFKVVLAALFLPSLTIAVSSTDEYQDCDSAQSGYLPDHNIDPTQLGAYKQAWKTVFNTNEGFTAKPLIYTPSGSTTEMVIVVSNANIIRVLNSATGALLFSRTLDPPFLATDSYCGDIDNSIGISGTPIIDPETDIMYFFSKGYKNGIAGTATINTIGGQYKFYGVKLPSLADVAGFPVSMEYRSADNDRARYFVGGTLLQRPGLAMVGNVIVGGFGGHCDNFNYTGMLVAITKSGVVGGIQAMVAAPGAPSPQQLDIMQAGNGKSGIWQGGMGLAVNGNNVYLTTGNGKGPGVNKVQGKSNSGKMYLSTLEQVVASFAVNPNTGFLTQQDWFAPWNYDSQLNGADQDMSASGVALLDRNTFNAPGVGVNGIAVASGKNGIVYVLDADNLGGFYNGKGFPDATLQQLSFSKSFYGGVASYPQEGGYLYLCPTGGPLYAYKYGLDCRGKPEFTLAGKGGVGTSLACNSNPTVTSFGGQPGTAVVWLNDVNSGVLAFSAVPVDGVMKQIPLGVNTGRLNKFQRTTFGNGRVFAQQNNALIAIAPVGGPSKPTYVPGPTSIQTPISASVCSSSSSQAISSSAATVGASSSPISSSLSTAITSSSSSSSSSAYSSSISVLSSSASTSIAQPTSSTSLPSSVVQPASSTSLSSSVAQLSSSSIPPSSVVQSTSSSTTVSAPTLTYTPNPKEQQVAGTFNYIGCFTDGNIKTLPDAKFIYDPMTLESCATNCANYNYFGVEYGRECYCGYTLDYSLHAIELSCNKPCSGNATQICGAGKLLNVFQNQIYKAPPPKPVHKASVNSYGWVGCYTETTNGGPRALSATAFAADTMTVEACVSFCGAYAYAGIEYGRECYCGNVINPTAILTATTECSFLCAADKQAYCGAGGRLDMYQLGAAVSSSSVAISSTASPTSTILSSSSDSSTFATSVVSTSSDSSTTSSIPLTSSIPASTTIASSSTQTSSTAKGTATNVKAATRTYNWNVGWVNAAPDGFSRPMIGINGAWPCPPINANIGDTIKINLVNNLGNQSTSLHFHGLFQQNTSFADGPVGVTQCPIQPGATFVYQFVLTQSGSYWYHAHIGGQYMDGLRGPITIRDARDLNNYGNIDAEFTLTLSDFYHVEAPHLVNYFLSPNNYGGSEPVPESALINEAQSGTRFTVLPGKTYLFHIINMGGLAAQFLQFDQHDVTIIEVDGTYTVPTTVSQLFVAVAQRYSVLIKTKSTKTQNFAIVSEFMTDMFDSSYTPDGMQPVASAYLVYDPALPMPAPFDLQIQPWDDTSLQPWDMQPMWDSPNIKYIYLTATFASQNSWGSNRASFNGRSYIGQKVPTLYSVLTAPANYLTAQPQIYGPINAQIIPFTAAPATTVVEISINNHDSRAHPFHLHGHAFQVIQRAGQEPQWPGLYDTPVAPIRRDTLVVYPGVGATIRFKADNPGVWLFHCHTEWHVEAGMTATFMEGLDELVARKPYIPATHRNVCDSQKIPRKGNAGGNSKNWLDVSNANVESDPAYYGAMVTPPAFNPYQGPVVKAKRHWNNGMPFVG